MVNWFQFLLLIFYVFMRNVSFLALKLTNFTFPWTIRNYFWTIWKSVRFGARNGIWKSMLICKLALQLQVETRSWYTVYLIVPIYKYRYLLLLLVHICCAICMCILYLCIATGTSHVLNHTWHFQFYYLLCKIIQHRPWRKRKEGGIFCKKGSPISNPTPDQTEPSN